MPKTLTGFDAAMAAIGFHREGTGGNCDAYIRYVLPRPPHGGPPGPGDKTGWVRQLLDHFGTRVRLPIAGPPWYATPPPGVHLPVADVDNVLVTADEQACVPDTLDETAQLSFFGFEQSEHVAEVSTTLREILQVFAGTGAVAVASSAVAADLAVINAHRRSLGMAPLDPVAAGWTDEDIRIEADTQRARAPNPAGSATPARRALLAW